MDYPNWFGHYAQDYFERHLNHLAGTPGLRFLQVGAFTGDATAWLCSHVLTGEGSLLVDVDTWRGSDEPIHEEFTWPDVERAYDQRTRGLSNSGRLVKFKGSSQAFFRQPPKMRFDFVYIDGDHSAFSVLTDGIHAANRLNPGGLIAFDDYLWKSGKGYPHDPGPAIDMFGTVFEGQVTKLEEGLQVWFQKT